MAEYSPYNSGVTLMWASIGPIVFVAAGLDRDRRAEYRYKTQALMSQFVVVGPEIADLAGTSVDPVPDPAHASC